MKPLVLAALAFSAFAAPASAQQAGHWTWGVGVHGVTTASASHTPETEADGTFAVSGTYEYFVRENLGIEAALPLSGRQDYSVAGQHAGSFVAVSPSVAVLYHFNGSGNISPYLGAGLAYTVFLDQNGEGVLDGVDPDLHNKLSPLVQAGVDFAVGERSSVRAGVRWMDLSTDIKYVGTLDINPLYWGVSYVVMF